MGDVIPVDFAALRREREQTAQVILPVKPLMTTAQACMLQLTAIKLTAEEQTELTAALSDYECYVQATEHIQVLVDIYQMLEAF